MQWFESGRLKPKLLEDRGCNIHAILATTAKVKKEESHDKGLAKLMDDERISRLLEDLSSKKCAVRWPSFRKLLKMSESNPKILYPYWGLFVERLDSDNVYWKYQSIFLIANLVMADEDNRFERIFDKYFDLLYGESLIAAVNLAGVAWKIVKAKPKLEQKVTDRLIHIDRSKHKHKDIMKAGAIESLDKYFDKAKDKEKILRFVQSCLRCDSPKARRKAKEFLKKCCSESQED